MIASTLLDALRPAPVVSGRSEVERLVRGVIDDELIDIVHQPIIGLVTCDIIGAEALSRFPVPPSRPDRWFAEADSVGLGRELEMAAVLAALPSLRDLPRGAYLSINAGPELMCSDEFLSVIARSEPSRIVVELTEHAAIHDYDEVIASITRLRAVGARIAIDDVGSGFASFNHVLQIRPDVVKLDMSLTRDIDTDRARRAVAHGLLGVARDIGAVVVAEGVETQAELDTLVELGVDAAQGYFIARPAPLPLPPRTQIPRPAARHLRFDDDITDPRDALAFLARALLDDCDLESITRPILDAVLRRTGLETSFLTVRNPIDGSLEHRYVDNSASIQLPEGVVIPWDDTLCKRARDAGILWTADVPRDLPGSDSAAAFGVQTFVSIPIRRHDGSEFGTLCAASTRVRMLEHRRVIEVATLAALITDHTTAVES